MKVPFILKSILVAMVLCYISAAFISTDLNPANWTPIARNSTVILAWIVGIAYAIIRHLTKTND